MLFKIEQATQFNALRENRHARTIRKFRRSSPRFDAAHCAHSRSCAEAM